MRSVVVIHGRVEGMGYQGGCAMVAMRDWLGPDREPEYSQYSILDAPPAMPDGEYTVQFGNSIIFMQRSFGMWLPDVE